MQCGKCIQYFFLHSAVCDDCCETCAPILANRKRKQRFGGGLATTGFSPVEEVALWQIRGRPVIDGTILGLSSKQTGVSAGRLIATGISAILLISTFLSIQSRLQNNKSRKSLIIKCFAEPESSATLIQTAPTILDCAEDPIEVSQCFYFTIKDVVCKI